MNRLNQKIRNNRGNLLWLRLNYILKFTASYKHKTILNYLMGKKL